MRYWMYMLIGKDTGTELLRNTGFETEADAEEQANMDAKARNIKNYRIMTRQEDD